MIIAIDGPAVSGKGTLGRMIARHYGLCHLDTGLLYRAVAQIIMREGGCLSNTQELLKAAGCIDSAVLTDPGLRAPGIGEGASIVAQNPELRQALLGYQRDFSGEGDGAVIDGRDIGTVVCPHATVKLFVMAHAEERARRHYAQRREAGEPVTKDQVLQEILRRDERDERRASAPLRPAEDAHLLDTTKLDIEAAFEAAVELIDNAIGRPGCAS